MSWGESPQFVVIKKKWTVPLGQPRKTYGIESPCRFLLTMVFVDHGFLEAHWFKNRL